MKRLLLCVVVTAGWLAAGTASACIWDRETVTHEKQFKSSYLEQSNEPPSDGQEHILSSVIGLLASGAGLVMLLGGVVVGFGRGVACQRASQDRFDGSRP